MLPPLTIFSKFNLNESNLKIIIISGFAMYFLVLYELFPQFIFEEQNALFTIILPLGIIIVILNRKKIKLTKISLKKNTINNSTTKTSNESIDTIVSNSTETENSDIEALLAGTPEEKSEGGNSEIEALLAGTPEEKSEGGNSEIEALLAGTKPTITDTAENSLEDSDTHLMIMEKIEPIENDIQTIKTDFDQFKQDLTTVKEDVEVLSTSFESTLTDIKLLTTDMNNPLNFMKEDPIKKNIQTINVDELIKEPINSKSQTKSEINFPTTELEAPEATELEAPEATELEAPEATELEAPEATELEAPEATELPPEIISLVDELSKDFVPEQVFELTKIHCVTTKTSLDEKQLMLFIDQRNNSDFLTKKLNKNKSIQTSKTSQIQIPNELA